ncbi:MAG: ABC transporter ATP-binding protein [Thermomicrobia bacterium]|nr:ABC transporter ATP-binding protein [Thermomicrobia bacterium]
MTASPRDGAPLLEVHGLNVAYGDVQVLWDVDLVIRAGETVALVGSNGAGKSTLLNALSGLMPPLSGSIRMHGSDLVRQTSERFVQAGICHVPQGRRLFVGMTVRENLMMGAFSRTDGAAAIREDFAQVLSLFPRVKERLNQLAGKLSGGEQQMVAIGRGLMARPHLLMIDELSLGLSPIMVDTIFDVIKTVQAQGRTMLIVEQDIQAALEQASRGYVLDTGRITHEGAAADLLASDAIRTAYLGM